MALGSVRRRSKGTWEIRYEIPAGKDGKRQQCSKTVRGTKKAAEAELSQIMAELGKTPAERASKMRVEECCRLFLKERSGVDLRPNSVLGYEGFFRNYFLPECGHMPLATVDRDALQRVVNAMVHRGLAPITVRGHCGFMSGLFSWAVESAGFLSVSPVKGLTLPEVSDESVGQMLSREESVDLLATFEGSPCWLPTFLGLHTGMRPGEVLGLSWDDVDLAAGTVSVRHTLHQQGSCLGPPKTPTSVRTMSVAPVVVEVLRELEERKPSDFWFSKITKGEDGKSKIVSVPVNFSQVCALPSGQIMKADVWGKAFRSTLRGAGLKMIRLHDLRHTHASLLLLAGEPIHVVSKRLGHADIYITMKLYAHLLPSSDADAAAHFADILKMAGQ